MGYIGTQQTTTIDLGQIGAQDGVDGQYKGEWVKVITKFSRAQKRYLENWQAAWAKNAKVQGSSDGAMKFDVDMGGIDFAGIQDQLVCMGIVDWSFTDANGQPLPLQPDEARMAAIQTLPEDVFDFIHAVLTKKVTPRSPEAQASFPAAAPAGPPSEAVELPATGPVLPAPPAVADPGVAV